MAKQQRDSNLELLRIVAMLMVLGVHANFLVFGEPTAGQERAMPIFTFTRSALQMLCSVCVNVYILISGYFTIRLKKRSILAFLFMVYLYKWIGMAVGGFTGFDGQSMREIAAGILLPGYRDWFVEAYIILMLLSPMINAFIDRSSLKAVCIWCAAFFGIELFAGWLLPYYNFQGGYSALSFIGLYMAGNVISRTKDTVLRYCKPARCAGIYFGLGVGAALLLWALVYFKGVSAWPSMRCYCSPVVLICSVALFVWFASFSFHSRIVNRIAASSFAVYLLHMNYMIWPWVALLFRYTALHLLPWVAMLAITGEVAAIFILCVAVDAVRRILWDKISGYN